VLGAGCCCDGNGGGGCCAKATTVQPISAANITAARRDANVINLPLDIEIVAAALT
jgi:hypothetical protein